MHWLDCKEFFCLGNLKMGVWLSYLVQMILVDYFSFSIVQMNFVLMMIEWTDFMNVLVEILNLESGNFIKFGICSSFWNIYNCFLHAALMTLTRNLYN